MARYSPASHDGSGAISKLTVRDFEFFAGSVATIVTVDLPAFFGAPERMPVFASNLSPSGSLPLSLYASGDARGLLSIVRSPSSAQPTTALMVTEAFPPSSYDASL